MFGLGKILKNEERAIGLCSLGLTRGEIKNISNPPENYKNLNMKQNLFLQVRPKLKFDKQELID